MSNLDVARTQFYTALEGLKKVHTREGLDIQRRKVEEAKKHLLTIDPNFKLMIEENIRKRKIEADKKRAEYVAKMADVDSMVSKARMRAETYRREAENHVDSWVKARIVKSVSENNQSEDVFNKIKLLCPICHDTDKGNLFNGVPTCMSCFHKLVTKSNLKKYNRDYRRKWKRKRGKMF